MISSSDLARISEKHEAGLQINSAEQAALIDALTETVWRPLETAPDGEILELWDEDEFSCDGYNAGFNEVTRRTQWKRWPGHTPIHPTHWRPRASGPDKDKIA